MKTDHEFENELKKNFIEEAKELLDGTEQMFLELENAADSRSVIEKIFRVIHTVKGSAGAVGFNQLAEFAHELEFLLSEIRTGDLSLSPGVIEGLLQANDFVRKMVQGLDQNRSATFSLEAALAALRECRSQKPSKEVNPPPQVETKAFGIFDEETPMKSRTVHSKSTSAQADRKTESKQDVGDESIRVSLARIDQLVRYVGELSIHQSILNGNRFLLPSREMQSTVDQLTKITKDIQHISLGLRMLPLKPIFGKMRRIVRDTSTALDKDTNIILLGEEVEVDKTILEKIEGPLVHLVRNAVDHGLEGREERAREGKNPSGQVKLAAFHEAGRLMIEVSDDGRGIDIEKLRAKGLEKGLLTSAEATDQEIYQLIFKSGISTKSTITDISGRGVGLDVVKTNIEALKGTIEIDSKKGEGTIFRIQLPLTLAIIHGMVVSCRDERYVIPIGQVRRMLKYKTAKSSRSSNLGHVFVLDDRTLPLLEVNDVLKIRRAPFQRTDGVIIVVAQDHMEYGLWVDDIIGQQPIVVRSLGEELQQTPGISGGAVLGDGKAALIIDVKSIYEKHVA